MTIRKPVPLRRCIPVFVLMVLVVLCASSVYKGQMKSSNRHPALGAEGNETRGASRKHKGLRDHTDGDGTLERRFPTCIVIGVKKGGTGAIIEYLDMHPDIRAKGGEIHFFSPDSNYMRGLEYYRRRMPYSYPHQMTIERTPKYWISKRALRRIHKFNEDIKLIVTLRHPVKRMISDYWQTRRILLRDATRVEEKLLYGNKTFEELAIDQRTGEVNMDYEPLNVSLYYLHLTRWLEYFPREQIHIVDGDNLIVNPFEEVEKMEAFLGLEHRLTRDMFYYNTSKGFYCMLKSDKHECLNYRKGHRHPEIDPAVYEHLMEFFKPLNELLFSLLRRRFDWI